MDNRNKIIDNLKTVFTEVANQFSLPENTFCVKDNFSKTGAKAGNLISTEIDIQEMSFPYDKNNKIKKSTLVLYITPNTTVFELMIKKYIFHAIPLPEIATITKEPGDHYLYFHVSFPLDDNSIYDYIKSNLVYSITNYESSNSFGCCSQYKECSEQKECLHSNKLYAKGCRYRENLENGQIFY